MHAIKDVSLACSLLVCTCLQVYDNRVYDLLRGVSAGRAAARQALEIKVLNQAAYVPGLTQVGPRAYMACYST